MADGKKKLFADSEHQGAQTSNAETPDAEATRTARDASGKRKTSYRRPNRNYSTHVDWTYELNTDIYRIYLAIKPSERGYMKRLKKMWDKEHPQLSHMTAKHLAVQVDRVIKKKLIRETGYIEQDATHWNVKRAITRRTLMRGRYKQNQMRNQHHP